MSSVYHLAQIPLIWNSYLMQANKNFSIAIQICIYMDFKGSGRYSSQELSESVDTNPVVIRRQLARLKNAGLVESQNGPNGGYYLTRSTSELNLWDLYTATREGEFFNRPKPNPDCIVGVNLKFLVQDTFDKAELSMKPEFESVSIRDLTKKLRKIIDAK